MHQRRQSSVRSQASHGEQLYVTPGWILQLMLDCRRHVRGVYHPGWRCGPSNRGCVKGPCRPSRCYARLVPVGGFVSGVLAFLAARPAARAISCPDELTGDAARTYCPARRLSCVIAFIPLILVVILACPGEVEAPRTDKESCQKARGTA